MAMLIRANFGRMESAEGWVKAAGCSWPGGVASVAAFQSRTCAPLTDFGAVTRYKRSRSRLVFQEGGAGFIGIGRRLVEPMHRQFATPTGDKDMSRRNWRWTVAFVPLLLLGGASAFAQAPANPINAMSPVTDAMLRNPPASDWLMWRRTYNGWGYSPLDQISKDNVKNLQVAWSWSLNNGATEMTPIVRDGVLYITNAGDKVQA